jgi:hypothetical protein
MSHARLRALGIWFRHGHAAPERGGMAALPVVAGFFAGQRWPASLIGLRCRSGLYLVRDAALCGGAERVTVACERDPVGGPAGGAGMKGAGVVNPGPALRLRSRRCDGMRLTLLA